MQKKLLTMAVAGALAAPGLALAQASVEVYGTVYPTFGRVKYDSGFTARSNAASVEVPSMSKMDVQAPSSNFGVRGRESIGAGLTAWFQIEQNAPLEREATQAVVVASRNSAGGIQGGFGNVFVGQWTTPWADLNSLWAVGQVSVFGPVTSLIGRRETTGTAPNPATGLPTVGNKACTTNLIPPGGSTVPATGTPECDAVVGGGGVGHPFWRRASDMIRYTSPTFGGVTFDIMYQVPELKTVSLADGTGLTAEPSMWSGSLKWSGMGGRARVGAAYDRHKDFTSIGKNDTGWVVSGGFNFGVVDVGLTYERNKYQCGSMGGGANGAAFLPALCASEGEITAKQYAVGVSVPVGVGAIKGFWGKAKDMEGAITVGETGAKEWGIGYEHRFSKRTSLGVEHAKIDNHRNAQFTWTGMAPSQRGQSNTPFFGSDVTWTFVSMTHRF